MRRPVGGTSTSCGCWIVRKHRTIPRSPGSAPCILAPVQSGLWRKCPNPSINWGELSGETIFIDGTKIEACANKYTFVWKKAVNKSLGKLLGKLAAFVEACEEVYGIRLVYQGQAKMKHVKKLRKKLYALKEAEGD